VIAYTGERIPWSHSAPPDRPIVGVSDEAGWHDSIMDLLLECASIVRRRGWSPRSRSQEQLAPAPGRILAASAEHRDHVVPTIRCRGMNLDRHGHDHKPRHGRSAGRRPVAQNGACGRLSRQADFLVEPPLVTARPIPQSPHKRACAATVAVSSPGRRDRGKLG
jgi:hypothetical protein